MKQGPIRNISDLKGKKIGYSVGGFEDALLSEMLSSDNLTLKDVELINVNFSLSPALISGKVDAVIGAFRNFELIKFALDLPFDSKDLFYKLPFIFPKQITILNPKSFVRSGCLNIRAK